MIINVDDAGRVYVSRDDTGAWTMLDTDGTVREVFQADGIFVYDSREGRNHLDCPSDGESL